MTINVQRTRALLLVGVAGVVSALSAGCAAQKTHVVPAAQLRPAQDATREQLLETYNAYAGAIQSLNATAEFQPTAGSTYSGVIHEYHDFHGFILAARPFSIRVIGQAPVIGKNIFDMVSDGQTFRIFIPSKNKFLVGSATLAHPSSKPIENLRPQHVLDALFWSEIPSGDPVLIEQFDATPNRYYILTELRRAGEGDEAGAELEIARKIWFDRADLSIVRIQLYGPGGRLDSDISYSEWPAQAAAPVGAASGTQQPGASAALDFARDIRITRPQDDYQLEIHITKLVLNQPIAPDKFVLQQPPGSELVHVGEDSGGGAEP